jgi:hypothetical protein
VQTYHRLGQLTRNETITISGNRSQVVSNYLTLSAEAFDLCLSKPCVSSSSSFSTAPLLPTRVVHAFTIGARVMTCAFGHTNSDLPASGHLYYGMLLCTMLKLPLALEQIKLALAKDVRLPPHSQY